MSQADRKQNEHYRKMTHLARIYNVGRDTFTASKDATNMTEFNQVSQNGPLMVLCEIRYRYVAMVDADLYFSSFSFFAYILFYFILLVCLYV